MKINQFNFNSYVDIRPKSTSPSVSVATKSFSSSYQQDSIRLTNIQGELRTNNAIQNNIQSGISLIQTMDASLSSAEEMGYKLKELAVQYQNGVLSDEDKKNIENEANEILKGLQKLFEDTTFNGQKVFDKPSFMIYTGGSDSYKIETPDVSKIKDIKPTELSPNTNTKTSDVEIELNLSLLQSQVNLSMPISISEQNNVENETSFASLSLSSTQPTLMSNSETSVSKNKAIEAYQQNSQMMSESKSGTVTTQSTSMQNNTSSNKERKDFVNIMTELFGSKKEAREFFGAKNDKDMLEKAKQETTESLVERFNEKGHGDKLDKAIELGLFEKLELEPPTGAEPNPTTPTEPEEPTDPSNPNEGTDTPVDGSNPGETNGSDNDNSNSGEDGTDIGDGTGSTETPAPPTEGEDGINTGGENTNNTGNTGGTGDSNTGNSEGTGETPTNPMNPTNPSNQWNFEDILKGDFIDKNILGVINKGLSNLRINEEILNSRLNFQERLGEIKEEQMTRLTNTNTVKSIMEEVKKQMLEQVQSALQVHQYENQKQLILNLLK